MANGWAPIRPDVAATVGGLETKKHTMSGLVARAEKRGIVVRVPNETDDRATDVLIAAEGAKLIKRLRAQGEKALAPVIGHLGSSDQQLLQEPIQRMLSDDLKSPYS